MAIFGNFKGTTQPDFRIGKTGPRVHGNVTQPSANIDPGDIWLDKSNLTVQFYNGNIWNSIGSSLAELNVDNGTLFVDSANDTVSIGSTSSNEKLFVNGSLRLGTNPAINYAGAYLDLRHSNGTGTSIRIRDNTSGVDPVLKVYNANNSSEVFKVQGNAITIANAYTLPSEDGDPGFVMVTNGDGQLTFAPLGDPVDDYGFITQAANITIDYGGVEVDSRSPVSHPSYTVAEVLGIAGMTPGDMVFVSDETGGATMAFFDGSDWRRIQDRQIIS
jgi:hypothetical protein